MIGFGLAPIGFAALLLPLIVLPEAIAFVRFMWAEAECWFEDD